MLRTFKMLLAFSSLLVQTLIAIPQTAIAQSNQTKPSGGVHWTKIQDLNPNAPPTNSAVRQKWAVVIGVGRFKERRLDSDARPDEAAASFKQYLLDPHGGRFDARHVKTLLNEEATQQDIVAAIGPSWLGRLAQPDDLVVIYVATNGFPTTDGNAYLCTYNCALDNIYASCLSMKTLMNTLRDSVHCNRIVLIVQSCYSGAAQLESGAKALLSNYNFDTSKLVIGKGHVLISSSQPDQISWGNIFTTNLIKALREEDGLIPLDEAFDKTRAFTELQTSQTAGYKRQTPAIKSDWKGHDLVLGTPQVEKVSDIPESVQNFLGAEAYYLKANRLVEAGKLDDAIKEYESALAADPKYSDVLADYGAVLAMKSDWPAAARKYQLAIQVRPNDALYHANYARVLSKLGKKTDCMYELEQAYQLEPKDRNVLTALSDRCLEAGDTGRSVDLLTQAVALYPKAGVLRTRLSYALSKSGENEQALSQAREAVKLDPDSVSARLNLGSLLLINGQSDSAIQIYRDSAERWPQERDVHLLLSKALEEKGDLPNAKSELSKFIELCPSNDPRAEAERNHLQQLGQN